MNTYPFDLIPPESKPPAEDIKEWLKKRPFAEKKRTLETEAPRFVAGEALATAMNTAIAVGDPLLLTGEPGTGKTQAAYYAAYQLGVKCIHFQVKSDSQARDLLYDFDMIRYFRDAHRSNPVPQSDVKPVDLNSSKPEDCAAQELDKRPYIEKRALWHAFELAKKEDVPQVMLIDEIDKAPRDFPNDLLHELDQMEFTIKETNEKIDAPARLHPIVFITSNSERRLPAPFLRRCVYHHIQFDDRIAHQAVRARRDEFASLSDEFLKLAVQRFLALRERPLRKPCATGELLVWLRVLSLAVGITIETLDENLSKLPYISVLLKDHQDIEELGGGVR